MTAIGFGTMCVALAFARRGDYLLLVYTGDFRLSMARSIVTKNDSRSSTELTNWEKLTGTVGLVVSPARREILIPQLAGADIYGDSEELLGKWFARTGKRDEIFLTTKFANKVLGGEIARREIDSSPEYCREACEKSLKKLGTDYIDLYYW